MATVNLHGARSDLSNVSVRVSSFPGFCTFDIKVGEDSVCVFLDGKHAKKAMLLADIIRDNLEPAPVDPVLAPG